MGLPILLGTLISCVGNNEKSSIKHYSRPGFDLYVQELPSEKREFYDFGKDGTLDTYFTDSFGFQISDTLRTYAVLGDDWGNATISRKHPTAKLYQELFDAVKEENIKINK